MDGRIVVERVHCSLADLTFCGDGEPTELGTARYEGILANLGAR